jgi:hypothetical protein
MKECRITVVDPLHNDSKGYPVNGNIVGAQGGPKDPIPKSLRIEVAVRCRSRHLSRKERSLWKQAYSPTKVIRNAMFPT